ncbi:MAG: hypothetical protein LBE31_03795, partial [Deltaproteobacteria bacterium]|nr:hypothetical protein [Deltaproteobacteria bacterium]
MRKLLALATLSILMAFFGASILLASNPSDDSTATSSEAQTTDDGAGEPQNDPASVTSDQSINAEDQLWRDRAADLIGLASEADAVLAEAKRNADAFDKQLNTIQNQFAHLQRIFGISSGHPGEQEVIIGQMQALRRQLDLEAEPLENSLTELNQRLSEVVSIQKSMDGQDTADASNLVLSYKNNLQLARSQMETARDGLEAILNPGQAALKSIEDSITAIENDVPKTWHDYYFSGGGASGLARTHQDLFKWASSFKSRAMFYYPQSSADWLGALTRFLVTIFIMTVAGYLILIGRSTLPPKWGPILAGVIKGPWVWMAIGLSLMAASSSSFGGSYVVFKLPGILILVKGLATLSWRLRQASNPAIAKLSSPLDRLLKPAAIGVTLLFIDIPVGVVSVLWVFTLIVY